MTIALTRPREVLADLVPGGLARDVVLVGASAVVVGLSAQVVVPLPFTPVPITGQTLAVLLVAAAIGPVRGSLGMLAYLAAGVAGVPWFVDQGSGWAVPTLGYAVGFVLAALLVGALARGGADRTPGRTVGLMALGNVVIYAVGVPWLMAALGVDLGRALALGLIPFLIGDAIKILLAAALLPGAWRLVGRST